MAENELPSAASAGEASPPGAATSAAATAPQAPAAAEVAAPAAPASPPVEAKPGEAARATPAVVEPAAEPKLEPTLLEKFDADVQAKTVEAEKKTEPKPTEAKPSEAKEAKPAEAAKAPEEIKAAEEAAAKEAKPELQPVEYKYTLPETLKLDDAQRARVHTAFDEFRADPAAGAQKLVDLHNEFMANYDKQVRQNQFDVFNKTKGAWETQVLADNELGGAGHQTAMQAVARARDATITAAKPGSKEFQRHQQEYKEFLAVTGAGSHPAYLRQMHNMAKYIDEPNTENSALVDIAPPKGNSRAPGRAGIYDHPSSQKMARS